MIDNEITDVWRRVDFNLDEARTDACCVANAVVAGGGAHTCIGLDSSQVTGVQGEGVEVLAAASPLYQLRCSSNALNVHCLMLLADGASSRSR